MPGKKIKFPHAKPRYKCKREAVARNGHAGHWRVYRKKIWMKTLRGPDGLRIPLQHCVWVVQPGRWMYPDHGFRGKHFPSLVWHAFPQPRWAHDESNPDGYYHTRKQALAHLEYIETMTRLKP